MRAFYFCIESAGPFDRWPAHNEQKDRPRWRSIADPMLQDALQSGTPITIDVSGTPNRRNAPEDAEYCPKCDTRYSANLLACPDCFGKEGGPCNPAPRQQPEQRPLFEIERGYAV
jgi:hypothetical protein